MIAIKRITNAEFQFIAPQLIKSELYAKPKATSSLARVYTAVQGGASKTKITLLAYLNEELVGIATVGNEDRHLTTPNGVLNIFVAPRHRGKRVGTELLKALCRVQGRTFHVVFTDSSTALFLSQGFDPAEHYSVTRSGRLIKPARALSDPYPTMQSR